MRAERRQRVLGAAGDVHLLLGADDEVAVRQDRPADAAVTCVGPDVALLARAMAGETPEVGAVVDVEHDLAAGAARDPHRLRCAAAVFGRAKCVPVTTIARGRCDEGLVDVALVERHVGAVLAVEDQREVLFVAHAEHARAR